MKSNDFKKLKFKKKWKSKIDDFKKSGKLKIFKL